MKTKTLTIELELTIVELMRLKNLAFLERKTTKKHAIDMLKGLIDSDYEEKIGSKKLKISIDTSSEKVGA